MNTEPANLEKLDYFVQLYVAAHVVGLLSILLVFYWCVAFAGGFGLSGGPLFQWHPLFMSIGIIYLMGNGRIYFVLENLLVASEKYPRTFQLFFCGETHLAHSRPVLSINQKKC